MESLEKEFVSYEIALQMKELEFDEPCFRLYKNTKEYKERIAGGDLITNTNLLKFKNSNYCAVPTYSQCFRFFREKKYHSGIIPYYDYFYFTIKDFNKGPEYNSRHFESDDLRELSFEEAETECLKKLIEICQEK